MSWDLSRSAGDWNWAELGEVWSWCWGRGNYYDDDDKVVMMIKVEGDLIWSWRWGGGNQLIIKIQFEHDNDQNNMAMILIDDEDDN